jgi:hypothetical protein
MQLGKPIQTCRRRKGMAQRELARRAGGTARLDE